MRQSGGTHSRGFVTVLGLGDGLRRTAGVGVVFAEIIERDLDFFLAYLVALVEDVSWVLLEHRRRSLIPCPGTFGVSFARPAIVG